MTRSIQFVLAALALASLAGTTMGCASIRNADARDTERMLAGSGFQMRLADSPEQKTQLAALPQRKLTPHTHEGRNVFLYADSDGCDCLYVGTERAYQRYQRMAEMKGIAQAEEAAAESREDMAMDLGTFGPWGPWW